MSSWVPSPGTHAVPARNSQLDPANMSWTPLPETTCQSRHEHAQRFEQPGGCTSCCWARTTTGQRAADVAAGRARSSWVWPSTALRRLAFMDSAIVTVCELLE